MVQEIGAGVASGRWQLNYSSTWIGAGAGGMMASSVLLVLVWLRVHRSVFEKGTCVWCAPLRVAGQGDVGVTEAG